MLIVRVIKAVRCDSGNNSGNLFIAPRIRINGNGQAAAVFHSACAYMGGVVAEAVKNGGAGGRGPGCRNTRWAGRAAVIASHNQRESLHRLQILHCCVSRAAGSRSTRPYQRQSSSHKPVGLHRSRCLQAGMSRRCDRARFRNQQTWHRHPAGETEFRDICSRYIYLRRTWRYGAHSQCD